MMKLTTALGVALASLTVAAYADPAIRNVVVRHAGPSADADNDGWVSRAEAGAAAERHFDDMDSNDDGRLTPEDRPSFENTEGVRVLDDENCTTTEEPARSENENGRRVERRSVTIICHGDGEGGGSPRVRVFTEGDRVEIEREVERAIQEAERGARDAERGAREAERAAEGAERHAQREVVIVRNGGRPGAPPMPPMPPMPHFPMFMMMSGENNEADLNGDGAMSRDEFRAQHLRFFDANDANNDGRVKAMTPPTPPQPPTPPEPPRRR